MKKRGQRRRKVREVQQEPEIIVEPNTRFSDDTIEKALLASRGNMKVAAAAIGMPYSTLRYRVKASERLMFAKEQGEAVLLTKAINSAEKLLDKHHPGMTQFMLKTVGADQFSEKKEIEISVTDTTKLPTRTEEEQIKHDNDVNDILMELTG